MLDVTKENEMVSDDTTDKHAAKAVKKSAKAAAKRLKKEAKQQPTVSPPSRPRWGPPSATPATKIDSGPTPAERSAAAAERQVRLQQRRVLLSAVGVAIALATLLWATKPWLREVPPTADEVQAPTTQPR